MGKKIRDSCAPQLHDIDGDSCHHLNNASKRFCGPFERWVEALLSDLHTDHKCSADGLRNLQHIWNPFFTARVLYSTPVALSFGCQSGHIVHVGWIGHVLLCLSEQRR